VSQLAHHLQMTGVVLYAYVLMDNHFHGLVRTPRANLSVFVQPARHGLPTLRGG
jgi:hypothetical protein